MNESDLGTKVAKSMCARALVSHDKVVLASVILIMSELIRMRLGYMGILSLELDGFPCVDYRESAFLAEMVLDALLKVRSKESA